jgi:hypothetical protein
VAQVAVSPDGGHLAARSDACPTAVFVWALDTCELAAVLLHLQPVFEVAWQPSGRHLAIVTGGSHVSLWSAAGATTLEVPAAGFHVQRATWQPTGGAALLLQDQEQRQICMCYLPE